MVFAERAETAFSFGMAWYSSFSQPEKHCADEIMKWEMAPWVMLEGQLQILHHLY